MAGLGIRQVSSYQSLEVFVPPTILSRSVSSYRSTTTKISRVVSSYSVSALTRSRSVSSYRSFAMIVSRQISSFRNFVKEARVIYATNTDTNVLTKLGTLIDAQFTLVDVPLADGPYLIEVRSSLNYWTETQSRITFPIVITLGVIAFTGIPSIINLRANVKDGLTTLKWSIPEVNSIDGLTFGIWEDISPSVDTSGAPDYIVQLARGVGVYQAFVAMQTVDMYYAVACFSTIDQGPVSEVLSPWSAVPPISPPNQNIYS